MSEHATGSGRLSRARIRHLSSRRGHPAVSSVYLNVDGRHRPVTADIEHAFEWLADDLRRQAARRNDIALARSVEGDIAHMRGFLAGGIERSVTRGVALFSCQKEGYFEAITLPSPVHDEAYIGTGPRVRQLVELQSRAERLLVALVDRAHLRLLRVEGEQVSDGPTITRQLERTVDTSVELGSWEHHREEEARSHLRQFASELTGAVEAGRPDRLVLGGPDDSVSELEDLLATEVRAIIIGRVGVRLEAPAHQVAAAAREVAELAEKAREERIVEELRQLVSGDHRAAVGLEATLEALGEKRVGTLLVSEEFVAPGAICPSCGHVGPGVRQCPVCGSTNLEVEDVVEMAIEEAIAQDAEVCFCHETELERFGRIGVLERY